MWFQNELSSLAEVSLYFSTVREISWLIFPNYAIHHLAHSRRKIKKSEYHTKPIYGATTFFINILVQNSPLWSKYAHCIFHIKLQTLAKIFVICDGSNNCDFTQFKWQRTCQIVDFSIELSTSKTTFTVSCFHSASSGGFQSPATVLVTHLD